MYHLWFLVYQRVLLQLHHHLLIRHLHRRTLYLTSAGTRQIPQPKAVELRVRSYRETRCIDQQKPETQKNEGHEEVQSDLWHSCRSSEQIWSTNVVLQSHGETLSLDVETLPVLLMNYQWSREQKRNLVFGSTRTFRRTQNVIFP